MDPLEDMPDEHSELYRRTDWGRAERELTHTVGVIFPRAIAEGKDRGMAAKLAASRVVHNYLLSQGLRSADVLPEDVRGRLNAICLGALPNES